MAIEQSTDSMLNGYKNELKDIVDVMALSLASATKGIDDENDIHAVYTTIVKDARFFPDKSGYFFIYKLGGKVFVHAAQPKLEGRTLLLLKDADGKPLIQELESKSKQGGGFVDYWWEKPGKGMLPKLSYARMIPDSPYWIGTGVYIDDVQKKKEAIFQTIDKFSTTYLRKLYIALAVAFIVLVVPLTIVLIRSIVQPLTKLTIVADKFSRGKMDLDIPDLDRQDEVGKLAKALERLGTSTRLAMQRLAKRRKAAGHQEVV
jgi:methyl-accepting chemotaxis protein